ncbi:hypothetical protein PI126_g15591 [Phytophthora idaei]|nr:hypothetical protein PI126_g15591 [Phytophthora idaei]
MERRVEADEVEEAKEEENKTVRGEEIVRDRYERLTVSSGVNPSWKKELCTKGLA